MQPCPAGWQGKPLAAGDPPTPRSKINALLDQRTAYRAGPDGREVAHECVQRRQQRVCRGRGQRARDRPVRDSKRPGGPVIGFGPRAWQAFIAQPG
ncbi:DUF397 domain-containing protein [Streptomyces sp. NPDC085929]|uniref:DUF397 domain-containing protein n=1 Tax=Streptomyces sp. NPDC085929 TaxID=3365739 RepID=UPI0037D13A1C